MSLLPEGTYETADIADAYGSTLIIWNCIEVAAPVGEGGARFFRNPLFWQLASLHLSTRMVSAILVLFHGLWKHCYVLYDVWRATKTCLLECTFLNIL